MKRVVRTKTVTALILVAFLLITVNTYPFHMGEVEVRPRVVVEEIYDSNVTSSKRDRIDDFITSLSAGFNIIWEGKTQDLSLVSDFTWQIFAKNSEEFNNFSQDVDFRYRKELSRNDRIEILDRFEHAESPDSFQSQFGRESGRFRYYRNQFDARYIRDITKQFAVTMRYRNVLYDVVAPGADSYYHRGGVEANYMHSSATILLLSYDVGYQDFEPGTEAFTHMILGGLRQYITKQLYFDGKVGMNIADGFDGNWHVRPVFLASLVGDIDPKTRIVLTYEDWYDTIEYTPDLWDSWLIDGTITREFTTRLRGEASVFYGEGEFAALDVRDRFLGAGVEFTYDFRDNIRGAVGWTIAHRDSNDLGRAYIKNRVYVALTVWFE